MEKQEKEVVKNDGSVSKSISKQLLCSFVINLVSLLQGASVSTSSIILHELQNSSTHVQDSHHHFNNTTSNSSSDLGALIIFQDFHITQEEGSWIGMSTELNSQLYADFDTDTVNELQILTGAKMWPVSVRRKVSQTQPLEISA